VHEFDLLVIGGGTVGQSVAVAARKEGWSVAVIERRLLGGTCPNDGCDAKKPFVIAASAVDRYRQLEGRGVTASLSLLDWPAAVRFSAEFTDPVPDDTRSSLEEQGIQVILGEARFVGARRVRVGDQEIEARKVVIATGSHPRPLEFEGARHLRTSTQLMRMEAIPSRVAFIGGGYISFEFAHVLARHRREVVIYHGDDRPLKGFEPELADLLVEAAPEIGIRVEQNARATRIVERGSEFEIRVEAGDGGPARTETADLVIHGAGRVPAVEALDLAAAGLEAAPLGIAVDRFGRCLGNPDVYAGGDAADALQPKLLRAATHQARVISAHLLGQDGPDLESLQPVAVLFTSPPLAGIGMTEEQARASGLPISVNKGPEAQAWKILRQMNQPLFAYKSIVHRETDQILGAWVLGEEADAIVNLVALGLTHGIPAKELGRPLYGYPTVSGNVASLFR